MSDMTPYTKAVKDLDLALQDAGLERTRALLTQIEREVVKVLLAGAKIANEQRVEIERLTADLKFVNSALPREFISDGMGGVRKWRESWEAWVTDYARSRKLETEVRAALGIAREAITPADAATRLVSIATSLRAELRAHIARNGSIGEQAELLKHADEVLK